MTSYILTVMKHIDAYMLQYLIKYVYMVLNQTNTEWIALHKLILVLHLLTIELLQMTNSSYVTTESGNRQNIFPTETRPYIDESVSYEGYPQNAEKVNGRWAMIGFIALLGAYITTGQIIPGIF